MRRSKLKKIISSLTLASLTLIATLNPLAPSAHTQTLSRLGGNIDARCFTLRHCEEARVNLGASEDEASEGFVVDSQTKDVCGEKSPKGETVGFCLPIGKTVTGISFGGKREFADLGEFLQLIYRYAIILAGILAVVMIIVSGLQLTTSGGSADRVTAARKRLGGAIAGLLIALLSFVLLNALNPYLVNLRLPQVWMVNTLPIIQEGEACRTEGFLKEACERLGVPNEYVCRPHTAPGTCYVATEGFMTMVALFPLDLAVGGVGSQAIVKLGGRVFEGGAKILNLGKTGLKKYTAHFFTTPWQSVAKEFEAFAAHTAGKSVGQSGEQLAFKFVEDQVKKDVTRTGAFLALNKAVATAGTKLALGIVSAGGALLVGDLGFTITKELYDLINPKEAPGLAGVCMKSFKKPEGDLCNLNAPADCANGKCVDTGIGFSCWASGVQLGTCSSGKTASFCKTNADCQANLLCVSTEIAGQTVAQCTDGQDNSPCGRDSDCVKGGKCELRGGKKVCAVSTRAGEEGARCILSSECNRPYTCQTLELSPRYRECVRPCTTASDCASGRYQLCVTNDTSITRLQQYCQ